MVVTTVGPRRPINRAWGHAQSDMLVLRCHYSDDADGPVAAQICDR